MTYDKKLLVVSVRDGQIKWLCSDKFNFYLKVVLQVGPDTIAAFSNSKNRTKVSVTLYSLLPKNKYTS